MNYLIEKIGGTSMSRFSEIMEKVILNKKLHDHYREIFEKDGQSFPEYPYGRAFVVSAYAGVTDMLLGGGETPDKEGVYEIWDRCNDDMPNPTYTNDDRIKALKEGNIQAVGVLWNIENPHTKDYYTNSELLIKAKKESTKYTNPDALAKALKEHDTKNGYYIWDLDNKGNRKQIHIHSNREKTVCLLDEAREKLNYIVLPALKKINKEIFRYNRIRELKESDKESDKKLYDQFEWEENEEEYGEKKLKKNKELLKNKIDPEIKELLKEANDFISEEIKKTSDTLWNLFLIMRSGFCSKEELIPLKKMARETLAAVGESHSAHNSWLIIKKTGKNCLRIDLTSPPLKPSTVEENIINHMDYLKNHINNSIFIITGFAAGYDKIMDGFDRGYSEITFSKIAKHLKAKKAIIHKEFHLSSADPKILKNDQKAKKIERIDYQIAAQLADVGMEAIHPKAAAPLEETTTLYVRNAFDADDFEGTIIKKTKKKTEKKELQGNIIISGSNKIVLIEIKTSIMVGSEGFDKDLAEIFAKKKLSYIFKSTEANTISQVFHKNDFSQEIFKTETDKEKVLSKRMKKYLFNEESEKIGDYSPKTTNNHPFLKKNSNLKIECRDDLAIICVIGHQKNKSAEKKSLLSQVVEVFDDNSIDIKCMGYSLQRLNMQFVVGKNDYERAIQKLHEKLYEEKN